MKTATVQPEPTTVEAPARTLKVEGPAPSDTIRVRIIRVEGINDGHLPRPCNWEGHLPRAFAEQLIQEGHALRVRQNDTPRKPAEVVGFRVTRVGFMHCGKWFKPGMSGITSGAFLDKAEDANKAIEIPLSEVEEPAAEPPKPLLREALKFRPPPATPPEYHPLAPPRGSL